MELDLSWEENFTARGMELDEFFAARSAKFVHAQSEIYYYYYLFSKTKFISLAHDMETSPNHTGFAFST